MPTHSHTHSFTHPFFPRALDGLHSFNNQPSIIINNKNAPNNTKRCRPRSLTSPNFPPNPPHLLRRLRNPSHRCGPPRVKRSRRPRLGPQVDNNPHPFRPSRLVRNPPLAGGLRSLLLELQFLQHIPARAETHGAGGDVRGTARQGPLPRESEHGAQGLQDGD